MAGKMNTIYALLDAVRGFIKDLMNEVAKALNRLSGGRLTPNAVTLASLLMHLPLAWLIVEGYHLAAGLGLIVFGLFDTLDGQLARLQNRATPTGMFLDSTTDRIKEVLLYCGLTGYLLQHANNTVVVATVAALGASLITSYVNAWGEVALATAPQKARHQVNKSLRTGLGGFEVRMALIVIGLLGGVLTPVIYIILALGGLTVLQRIVNTLQKLR